MGQTLAERIQYEAAYDRNLIFKAYAGDLADLVAQLTARAERAEAALDELKILYADRDSDLAFEFNRAETAEAALKQCAEDALAAVPWKALLNIYECLTLPAVALDADVDRLASFLNQYAPWVPNESEERDDMEPPNRDFTTTGDFRRARGVIPWQPGDEPAETTIRRLRDEERAGGAEAALRTMTEQKEFFRVCWEEAEAALDDCRRSDNDSASDA